MAGKRRRTRADWAEAALRALGEGGLAAVAVEPLAASLGATKGSVYWHFPNREALLAAALELWEAERTEAIIALVDAEPDPVARLRRLLGSVLDRVTEARVEITLLSAAGDPVVAPVLRRVTDRRLGYLAALFAELGFAPEQARRRAVLAYSTYLGQVQLAQSRVDLFPEGRAGRRAQLDDALRVLTTPPAPEG